MECEYIKALQAKFKPITIEAFHMVTNGTIYCPIHKTTHEMEEKEDEQVDKA